MQKASYLADVVGGGVNRLEHGVQEEDRPHQELLPLQLRNLPPKNLIMYIYVRINILVFIHRYIDI